MTVFLTAATEGKGEEKHRKREERKPGSERGASSKYEKTHLAHTLSHSLGFLETKRARGIRKKIWRKEGQRK